MTWTGSRGRHHAKATAGLFLSGGLCNQRSYSRKKKSTACDTSPRGDAHQQTAAPRARGIPRTDCSREAEDQRFRLTHPANVERSEELSTRATNAYTKKQPANSFCHTLEVPRHELLSRRAAKKFSEFLFFRASPVSKVRIPSASSVLAESGERGKCGGDVVTVIIACRLVPGRWHVSTSRH